MVHQLSLASDAARLSSQETERQRAYLETLLTNLTSGVLSFDANLNIRTANQAANLILHVKVMRYYGKALVSLALEARHLKVLVDIVQPLLEQSLDTWQRSITVENTEGRKELLCQGSSLFSEEGEYIGAVVVFDDITNVIQAQKNAAWSEVARRLAHEIKNPLTPIQLSAERLQHKLLSHLDHDDAALLKRLTATIVQQVEAMKLMVNDFSEYARPVSNQTEALDLLALIREIIVLYGSEPQVNFYEDVDDNERYIIEANAINIRQVIHNLFKNSLEAMNHCGDINIILKRLSASQIELSLYDNGCGIEREVMNTIFEPYVTSKPKGTGLGLAIVKKVIEEQGGTIRLDKAYQQGAGFILQFPSIKLQHEG